MKSLMRKHVHRYALFALLLLAFLLGSVSTHGFAEMDGQAVMAQAQGKDDADDVLTDMAQKGPVVDQEELKAGEAEKIQEGNAEPAVEGENTGDTTSPLPENNSDTEPEDPSGETPVNPNVNKKSTMTDPSTEPSSEPGEAKEPGTEVPELTTEGTEETSLQPEQVEPLAAPKTLTNEDDPFSNSSEENVPEPVRGGNSAFTVTKRPVNDPDATEEPVGNYDTFYKAMESCKQEDTSNLYIITVNQDYTITATEHSWGKSKVNILLRSADGGLYSIGTQRTWVFFTLYQDCNVRIENLTLDGSHLSEFVFLADNGALTLGAGVTLQNFIDDAAQDGPAIYMQGQSSLTVEPGVVIQNNQSNTTGGVICGNSADTTINIEGGRFINNSSTQNGRNGGFGGIIATYGTLNITGGSFEGNSATNKGGAIWLSKNAKSQISHASFLNNQADIGGAISASCPLEMSECTLTANKATWGAGIFAAEPVTLSTINAAENQSTKAGGALYLSAGGTIENSTFSNNTAANQGGAIYLKAGDLALSGSKFSENTSEFGGGALYIGHDGVGNSQVASCAFSQNASSAFGGGIYLGRNGKLEVSASTFSNNEAAHGGGIATLGGQTDPAKSNLSIQSSNFSENVALSGGGVFTAVPTQINQTTFSKNKSNVHPDDDQRNPHVTGIGGALYVMDQRTDITASNFSGNTAYGSGGALCISGELKDEDGNVTGVKPAIMVNIGTSTRFEGNNVQVGQGGAIYCAPYEYANVITKDDAYTKLMMDKSTLFLKNSSGEGLFNPPSNYAKFTNLGFSSDSDVTHGVLTRESVLNNYDVNFKNNACLITYIANGGRFDDGSEQSVEEHELNENISIKAAPKREGYRFIAWQSDKAIYHRGNNYKVKRNAAIFGRSGSRLKNMESIKTQYQPGDSYTVKGNATFVAQWEAEETPTLRCPYPRCEIPVFTAPASVAPTPVPAAQNPKKIYNLPATGSASPARSILMGLGMILVGLLLKKRS